MKKTANRLQGDLYEHSEIDCLVLLDDESYIGGINEFSKWALYNFEYNNPNTKEHCQQLEKECSDCIFKGSQVRSFVYFDLEHPKLGEKSSVVFELFKNIAPKTCENFVSLCAGKDGAKGLYDGTIIHRIVPGMYLQGGRIKDGLSNGHFADESF